MAEDNWSQEQRRYLQSIVGTQDPAAVNPFDNSQPGLTGAGEGNVSDNSDLVQLPFRFTQFQLNAGNKAATGQWDRSATARSPFTSGNLAGELGDIQKQLGSMAPMSGPPTAPQVPELPQAPAPGTPVSQDEQANMRYGLPTKSYEVPSGLFGTGRNPLQVAREWESMRPQLEQSGFDMSKLGPMQTIEGYDIKAALGDEEYNRWMGRSLDGASNKATQQFYKNLEVLPTTFNPQLGDRVHQMNLMTRDFSKDAQLGGSPIQVREGNQTGSGPIGATQLLDIYRGAPEAGTAWNGDDAYNPYTEYMKQQGLAEFAPGDGEGNRPGDETWYTGPFGGTNPLASGQLQSYTLPDGQTIYFSDPSSQYSLGNTMDRETDRMSRMLVHDDKKNFIQRWAPVAIPSTVLAAMAAMTGGAAGALMAPGGAAAGAGAGAGAGVAAGGGAAGAGATGAGLAGGLSAGAAAGGAAGAAAAPTATGLAGAIGMNAGMGATGVNMLAGMVANYGVKAAVEATGISMDHPLMQAAMAVAGGAVGGGLSSMGGAPTAAPVTGAESAVGEAGFSSGGLTMPGSGVQIDPEMLAAGQAGFTPQIQAGGGATFTNNLGAEWAGNAAQQLPGASTPSLQLPNTMDYKGLGKDLLSKYAQATQAAATPEQAGGGGQSGYGAEYDMAYNQYLQEMEAYNAQAQQMQAYQQQLEQRAAQIQQMMAAYEQNAGDWDARQQLLSRQTGIQNQIQSNLAKSGAYDPNTGSLGGVQGGLWR